MQKFRAVDPADDEEELSTMDGMRAPWVWRAHCGRTAVARRRMAARCRAAPAGDLPVLELLRELVMAAERIAIEPGVLEIPGRVGGRWPVASVRVPMRAEPRCIVGDRVRAPISNRDRHTCLPSYALDTAATSGWSALSMPDDTVRVGRKGLAHVYGVAFATRGHTLETPLTAAGVTPSSQVYDAIAGGTEDIGVDELTRLVTRDPMIGVATLSAAVEHQHEEDQP